MNEAISKSKGQRWLFSKGQRWLFNGDLDKYIVESIGNGTCVVIQVFFTSGNKYIGYILCNPTWEYDSNWTRLEGQDAP